MAIIKKITQPGNNIISSLGGHLQIDEGRARFLVKNSDSERVIQMGQMDSGKYGVDWYDSTTSVNYMRAGELPDDTGGIVVAGDGINVDDMF